MPFWAFTAPRITGIDVSTIIAVAIVVGGCLIVAFEARHLTFTADDWSFVLARRGWTAQAILSPDNEHLAALPILAFKGLLAVFGLGSYVPFTTLLIVCHGIACFALYLLARPYVGPWIALAPAAIVAVLGPAWHVLLFYASITFVAAAAAGLCMALCLQRRDRKGDVGAGILLGVSLLISSVGLALVVFATVLIVLQRPTRWRRLLAVALPVAVYLVWYAHYGVSTAKTSNIRHIPHYVWRAASSAMSSITGLGQTHVSPYLVSSSYGRYVLVAVVAYFVFRLVRGLRPPPLTWAALATAIALWIAEAIEYFPNGREANQSRYQYVSAVLVLLAATSAAKGWRPGIRGRVAVAAATLFACGANLVILHDRAAFWNTNSVYARTETGALEVARGIVPPNFAPENFVNISIMGNHNLTPVVAGQYFSAVDEWGSSADSPQQILLQPEYAREAADLVVSSAEGLGPVLVSPARARGRTCRGVQPGGSLQVTLRPSAFVMLSTGRQSDDVSLRRFASSFRFVHWRLPRGIAVALRPRQDRASVPWHLRVAGGAGTLLCVAPATTS
jgi:hypothetical protein